MNPVMYICLPYESSCYSKFLKDYTLFLGRLKAQMNRWAVKYWFCGHVLLTAPGAVMKLRVCWAVTASKVTVCYLRLFCLVSVLWTLSQCLWTYGCVTILLPSSYLVSMGLCNFMFTRGLCPSDCCTGNKFLLWRKHFFKQGNSA
jgi:hypothetical protein